MTAVYIIIGSIILLLILRWPFIGVVITATSLPIIDLLPQIPVFSSITPIVGGVTLIGFIFHGNNEKEKGTFRLHNVYILGSLFIVWLTVSNPKASLFLGGARNWSFTFLQLLLLLILTGELLNTQKKQIVFIWVFSIASLVSATYAIYQGFFGDEFTLSTRALGFADNANNAARLFVVAMIFFSYLRSTMANRFARLFSTLGVLITFVGVFITVSRTGIVLLFMALGLLVVLQPHVKKKLQLIILFIFSGFMLLLLSDRIIEIISNIVPAISQGTDTIGLRYKLWEAAIRMWFDYPIQGVGIGMYQKLLIYYAQDLLPPQLLNTVPHNTYLQILAETGFIGLIIFMVFIGASFRNYWHISQSEDERLMQLRNAWFIVFVILLFGGITKGELADKLLWLVIGVSIYFSLPPQSIPAIEDDPYNLQRLYSGHAIIKGNG